MKTYRERERESNMDPADRGNERDSSRLSAFNTTFHLGEDTFRCQSLPL